MHQISSVSQDVLTMTSREIAALTGKEHSHVMRDIEVMLKELDLDKEGYIQNWIHPQNGQAYREFSLDRELVYTLLTGYSVIARRKVIARWHRLEADKAAPVAMSTMDILTLAMESERGRLLAIEQRDHAIATKAHISDKKTATAMATASAKSREVEKLKDQLGFNARHATVITVEKATGKKFGKQDWRPLKAWCKANGASSVTVPCARYGKAQAWPAGAWGAVYGVDLVDLFGGVPA
jgi:Phage regulatory protein Rha (Phage_pRha)